MDVNTAGSKQGPCCYNFSDIVPPYCPPVPASHKPDYPKGHHTKHKHGHHGYKTTPEDSYAEAEDFMDNDRQTLDSPYYLQPDSMSSQDRESVPESAEVASSRRGKHPGKDGHNDHWQGYDGDDEGPDWETDSYEGHRSSHHKKHHHGNKHEGYGFPKECYPPKRFTEYQISARQVNQAVLPVGHTPVTGTPATCPTQFDLTPVFAYGPVNKAHTWPAATIESQRYQPNRVQWVNDLKDSQGNFLPHIFDYAVDQTLHWANPEALGGSKDDSPCMACSMSANGCENDQDCAKAANEKYKGPVPIVTHMHGMEGDSVRDYSDGYTEAWYMPDAKNIPANTAKVGTWYPTFAKEYTRHTCQHYAPGSASFIYRNTQRPSTSWYHDHTLGLTRLNVYAGMAGFYFIRKFFPTYSPVNTGPELPGLPYPPPGGSSDPRDIREIPLLIQDRVFQNNSQLWYPQAHVMPADALPKGMQPPIWIPEFMFNPDIPNNPMMMAVNGRTWPKKAIAPDTYRLRLLNGCNARVLQLKFARTSSSVPDVGNANINTVGYTLLPFYVVGNEVGWFPQIQGPFTQLEVGQAERYDVIIDLSSMSTSDYVYLINTGPEAPYDGTNDGDTNENTSQLMRFEFSATLTRPATSFNNNQARKDELNAALLKEALPNLPPSRKPARQMALVEEAGQMGMVRAVLLGTASEPAGVTGTASPQLWSDPVRTTTPTDTIEEWEIINLTADAHPIHLHEVVYQTIERVEIIQTDDLNFTVTTTPANNTDLDPMLFLDCPTIDPSGKCPAYRDTSQLLPGTRTRLRFKSGPKPGLFAWHCHIVEHEDNEMMVPWCIGNPGYKDPRNSTRDFCPPV